MVENLLSLRSRSKPAFVAAIFVSMLCVAATAAYAAARDQTPDFLTYEELKTLSENPKPGGSLEKKLTSFWHTPLISNAASRSGIKALTPLNPLLGPTLRVATWNIEKSLKIPEVIKFWTDEKAFESMLDPEQMREEKKTLIEIARQRDRLIQADIVVLQEMEIGIKRSHYLNAPGELAKALQMNYAYAPQYLEVDPVTLGLQQIKLEDGAEDKDAMDYYHVDPTKYRGVFGSAVLSRYPIRHVEIRPLRYQAYDWYTGEKRKITFLEKTRRFGSHTAFKNEITRELKVGGRGYFRVDLEVPDVPGGVLTVINIHLEIKCQPIGREIQMREILDEIKKIKNPLIMLGDFNAASTDISPTSVTRTVKRTLKNPTTWFGVAVNYISPYGLAINSTRGASNVTKNFNDPFAKDISVVAPNPQFDMFNAIKNFRFEDGKAFDFRGDPERSIGAKDKMLANSNQRGRKGFKTSFSVKRALGIIGKYRLDWIFVKSQMTDPEDKNGPYRLAPHFGETLEEMNTSFKQPLSDHHPSVIDLPLEEPTLKSIHDREALKAAEKTLP
ncbi:MAG: endonuclease/exonuclease/phosphatase family protein [Candidatus Omnitrophica bacterium]|nr:endonuclease/exonuclease/phosphatase family protein [Candidatus Omnitrophota bacterium]